jgi:hypothetical protein
VAVLEYEAPGTATWTELAKLTTTSTEGFIYTHVAITSPGTVRIAWADPVTEQVYYSRTVPISR